MDIKGPEVLKEAKAYFNKIKKLIPDKIDDDSIDNDKLSFKIRSLEYLLAKRILKLSEIVFQLIKKKNYLAIIILTRSVVETGAILYSLDKKIQTHSKSENSKELNNYLMRSILGSSAITSEKEDIKPFNVLNAIDIVEKDLNGFRRLYDILCDYTHPNYSGLMNMFSNLDDENKVLNFVDERFVNEAIYLGPFAAILGLSYNSIKRINDNYTKIRDLFKT